MRKLIPTFFFCSLLSPSFAQPQQGVSTYLQAQYTKTLYDYTAGNNPWGAGLGLQAFLPNKTRFQPTLELTADLYLENDKVLRLNPDGSFPERNNSIDGMVNVFAGLSFHPEKSMYVAVVAGPSFISGQTLPGIKPSFGFAFSKKQNWTGKVAYINVFNRTKMVDEDFGSISFALALRLF